LINMKSIGNVQGGEALIRFTSLGEVGLVKAEDNVINNSIYWNSKLDALCALEAAIEIVLEEIKDD